MQGNTDFSLRWDKFTAVVAYLTDRSRNDGKFGTVKLVKLLYYSDCAAYLATGQPITGATYIRMPHGPYPDSWQTMLARLQDEGVVEIVKEGFSKGYQRNRPIGGNQTDLSSLTEREKSFLDDQLRRFADFSGQEIEDYSHDELAWRVTDQGQPIPHRLLGIRTPGPITEGVRTRGNRIADRIRKNGRQPYRIVVERDDAV